MRNGKCDFSEMPYVKAMDFLLKEKNITAVVEKQFSMQEYTDSSLQVLFFHSKITQHPFEKSLYLTFAPTIFW